MATEFSISLDHHQPVTVSRTVEGALQKYPETAPNNFFCMIGGLSVLLYVTVYLPGDTKADMKALRADTQRGFDKIERLIKEKHK